MIPIDNPEHTQSVGKVRDPLRRWNAVWKASIQIQAEREGAQYKPATKPGVVVQMCDPSICFVVHCYFFQVYFVSTLGDHRVSQLHCIFIFFLGSSSVNCSMYEVINSLQIKLTLHKPLNGYTLWGLIFFNFLKWLWFTKFWSCAGIGGTQTGEAEAGVGGSLWVWGWVGLHSELQAS